MTTTTTTNYGWTIPNDSELVKDGAAAIRTLGNAVDTTVKALNAGTTSGDIDYYTSATTKARLAKGTANQVLAMNSGATAPEWQTLSTGGMTLLSTTTLSGASTTVSSISQSYKHLYILIQKATNNSAMSLSIKPNSTAGLANYARVKTQNATASTDGNYQNEWTCGNGIDATSSDNHFSFMIYDYANTSVNKPFTATENLVTGAQLAGISGGVFKTNSAISSFQVIASAGSFTGGTIKIYGVN